MFGTAPLFKTLAALQLHHSLGVAEKDASKRKREVDAAQAQVLANERATKKSKKMETLKAVGEASLTKLRAKSGDASKLTMAEMESIALRFFDKELTGMPVRSLKQWFMFPMLNLRF